MSRRDPAAHQRRRSEREISAEGADGTSGAGDGSDGSVVAGPAEPQLQHRSPSMAAWCCQASRASAAPPASPLISAASALSPWQPIREIASEAPSAMRDEPASLATRSHDFHQHWWHATAPQTPPPCSRPLRPAPPATPLYRPRIADHVDPLRSARDPIQPSSLSPLYASPSPHTAYSH